MSNPLLALGFPIPFDRIEAKHVGPAVDRLLEQAQTRIDAIAADSNPRTYASTLGALEAATQELELVMTVVGHLESTATTEAMREANTAARPKVSAFSSSIPTNPELWNALKAFAETEEARELDATRARFLEHTLDGFRLAGADLSPEDKEILLGFDVELSKLTTQFSQNTLDATNSWELVVTDEARLSGLPPSAIEAARESAAAKDVAGWRFTLQAPSLIPVLTYLDDASIREQIWRAYYTRASGGEFDNRTNIARILELRSRKARLLGFRDFTDLVLKERMAKTGARAQEFLDDLRARSEDGAAEEHAALCAFRRSIEGADSPPIEAWDLGYYAEKQRLALYEFDEEQVRPYFSVPTVLKGMFEIVERLYGIRVEETSMPTWDAAVLTYRMRDEKGAVLANFYVDLYPRENKRGGGWMNPVHSSTPKDHAEAPHLGLFCANLNPPVGGRPALLSHSDVETLFHEFGHLMHHCVSQVTVRSLAGANVAWDFVELPSQIMENWCWEREALDLFARHWETGEALPEELYQRMTRARMYRQATGMTRQLCFGLLDLALHRSYDPARDGDVMDYAREITRPMMSTSVPDDYAMLASFGHLFASSVGYAGGYYSYMWAEVLDADAFSRFRDEGIFDRGVGSDFMQLISSGDSRDPMELFVNFRGREPELDALLERKGLVQKTTA